MNGQQLRELRERQGWTQDQLGELLKASLGRGSSTTVGKWEKGVRPIPGEVERFLAQVELEATFPLPEERPLEGEHVQPVDSPPSSVEGDRGDSAPPEPGEGSREAVTAGQLPLPGGGSYSRVCEELWELVATGVGMIGAVTGSEGLRADGEIIARDKAALGRAYGKLAESNATFRRMLLSATGGGAWLEVALVSGITFGKCYRSHQEIGRRQAEERERLELEEVETLGDRGGSPSFPAEATAA